MSNKSNGKINEKTQMLRSASVTQIVCFAIVAAAAVLGFVQARRALYEFGIGSSSVIAGDKYSQGDDSGSPVDTDGTTTGDGKGAFYFSTTAQTKATSAPLTTSKTAEDKTITTTTSTTVRTTEKTAAGTTKVSENSMVKITASPVNIREGAGTGFKVIARTTLGRTYRLISTENASNGKEWYQIAVEGDIKGWVLGTCCRILNESELRTTTAGNSETKGGTTTSATTTTTTTTTVKTTKKTTAKITSAAETGDRVEIKETPVNIRSGAGGKYKAIARAKKNDSYRFLSEEKDSDGNVWYKISLEGDKTGWVMSSLCRLVREDGGSTTTTAGTSAKTTTTKRTTAKSTTTRSTTSTTAKTTTTTTSAKADGKSVEISVSPVNIRSGPGMGYKVIERTERGRVYRLISVKKNKDGKEWCKIALSGSEVGWILRSCCKVKGEEAETTASSSTTTAKTTTTAKSTTTTTRAEDKLILSIQPTEHDAKYFIVVYKGSQSVVVYGKDDNGDYTKSVKKFTVSTGKKSSPTRTGKYRIRAKYRWRWLVGDVYGQYNSSISSDYLFHSVPYLERDASTLENEEYDKLGTPASKGCIRMCVRDCKWIYDNCNIGTDVRIVNDSGPSGPGVPKRRTGNSYKGWDPSDKWAEDNPYFS